MNEAVLAKATYIGQTADVLAGRSGADAVAAGISQKALFQRRGEITLYSDRLVLSAWEDGGDLVLWRGEVRAVRVTFTELYGRFIGGLLNAGKPLIVTTAEGVEIYLLIDRKELMETTDDRRWGELLENWLRG